MAFVSRRFEIKCENATVAGEAPARRGPRRVWFHSRTEAVEELLYSTEVQQLTPPHRTGRNDLKQFDLARALIQPVRPDSLGRGFESRPPHQRLVSWANSKADVAVPELFAIRSAASLRAGQAPRPLAGHRGGRRCPGHGDQLDAARPGRAACYAGARGGGAVIDSSVGGWLPVP
jgi:hypothetical protein